MRAYMGSEIRNVAVVGHAHCGKTTLIAALLHAAKMTPALGRVEDGSAVTAYDEEDIARRHDDVERGGVCGVERGEDQSTGYAGLPYVSA